MAKFNALQYANQLANAATLERVGARLGKSISTGDRPPDTLLEFIQRTNPRYKPAWFHRVICGLCDRVLRGEIQNLIIALPPRHGKTEAISRRLPAYLLGKNPNAQIIATSYSADLASRNNRDVQRIIDSPLYHGMFPATTLSGKNARTSAQYAYLRNNDMFEIVNHRGSYRAAGVGGGITGMGFGGEMSPDGFVGGLGLIDDYLKNRMEAESPTVRNRIWEWYTSTFRTRREDNAPIIVIATQWGEDDLIGRLVESAEKDSEADQWMVVKFPAIAEGELHPLDERLPGESLWEEKYPIESLLQTKATLGTYDWEALYQQNPTPRGGAIIKTDWIRTLGDRPPSFGRWILSVDSKAKDIARGSYSVVQAWGENFPDYVLFDQWRKQQGFVGTCSAIEEMLETWVNVYGLPSAILIEDKANGPTIIETLKGRYPAVKAIQPKGDKISRFDGCSSFFESGHVFVVDAPWVAEWIAEITTFPSSPKDDQVDATSQALEWFRTKFISTSSAGGGKRRISRILREL